MEELVRPWREQYRAFDATPFEVKLRHVPALPLITKPLESKRLKLISRPVPLPFLRYGDDKILTKLDKSTAASTRTTVDLLALRDVPSLEAILEYKGSSWCSATSFSIPDLTSLPVPAIPEQYGHAELEKENIDPAVRENATQTQAQLYRSVYFLTRAQESDLFSWNSHREQFDMRHGPTSVIDIAPELLEELVHTYLDYGTKLRRLDLAKDYFFDNAKNYTAIHMALAVFLRSFLQYCSQQTTHERNDYNPSFIALSSVIEHVREPVDWLVQILNLRIDETVAGCLMGVSAKSLMNNVEKEVRLQTSVCSTQDRIARELLLCLVKPLMDDLTYRIRLTDQKQLRSCGLLVAESDPTYSFVQFREDCRPHLLSEHGLQQIAEVQKGVLFLDQHANAEVKAAVSGLQILQFELTFELDKLSSWHERQVAQLSPIRLDAVQKLPITTGRMTKQEAQLDLQEKILCASAPLPQTDIEVEEIAQALWCHDTISTSLELDRALQICLYEPLQQQSILVHKHVLHVLLHDMKLREHLELIQQVFLLQSGLFTSKLRAALFSDDANSINLNKKLQHGDRRPPRASKVSVATRSLLAETIGDRYLVKSGHSVVEKEFLGQLGILITLEDDQVAIPRTSMDALSFLRFTFHPPKPVYLIITPQSCRLYSKVNRFLLILLRMIDVVDQLTLETRQYRTMQRLSSVAETFGIQATNFIRSFSAHIFETVITVKCHQFMQLLDQPGISIEKLRDAHLSMLEQICNSALLSPRMADIQSILRTVFQAVLSFSQIPAEQREHDSNAVPELHALFITNARKLIAVLTGAEATKEASFATGCSARFLMNDFWMS